MNRAPPKRRAIEYPPVHVHTARRIAFAAAPTLNATYDNPPRSGPFRDRNDIKIYRAEWHTFRELLRTNQLDERGLPTHPENKLFDTLYRILRNLTTKTVSLLQPDGTESLWIEFAPHPFVVAEWRVNPELFESDKIVHANYVASQLPYLTPAQQARLTTPSTPSTLPIPLTLEE
jgi:hypothetical protein